VTGRARREHTADVRQRARVGLLQSRAHLAARVQASESRGCPSDAECGGLVIAANRGGARKSAAFTASTSSAFAAEGKNTRAAPIVAHRLTAHQPRARSIGSLDWRRNDAQRSRPIGSATNTKSSGSSTTTRLGHSEILARAISLSPEWTLSEILDRVISVPG